ncbi:MAG: hypothetical protein LBB11_01245, partial [Puniceicoccales bacterium]|nr:hypothetical protein [Puniceicoccales bacterium]
SEEKEKAKLFLRSKGIIVEDLYGQNNIDLAWNDPLIAVTQNVVRINEVKFKFSDDAEATLYPYSTGTGTGTLIDVGIPKLRGRVVATCAHCVLSDFSKGDEASSTAVATMGDKILSANSQNSQNLVHFSKVYSQDLARKKANFFDFAQGNWSSLSITTEYKKGQITDIPITDIYFLTKDQDGKKCYDVCITILERPVKYNDEIVPGINLKQLNVITDTDFINVSQEDPFHIYLDNSNNFPPIVIGYGNTGIYEERKSFSYLDQETKDFITGFGIKKAIVLRGLDLNFTDYRQNMKACRCARGLMAKTEVQIKFGNINAADRCSTIVESCYKLAKECYEKMKDTSDEEMKKIHYDQAKKYLRGARQVVEKSRKMADQSIKRVKDLLKGTKKMIPFFAGSQASNGFSGSLVFRVKKDVEDNEDNENKNYDVVGIFSGPLFTEEIKSFIKNAADDYCERSLSSLKYFIEDMRADDNYEQFSDGLKCFIQDMRDTAGDDHEWFSDNLKYSIEDVRNIAGDNCEWVLSNLKRFIKDEGIKGTADDDYLSELKHLLGI